jgi:hypothetical protein
MKRPGRRATLALCLATTILWASAAAARTERFRWTETTSGVSNFRLYWGYSSGSYSSSLNVGVPAKDSTGAYYYDLVVADADTIYVTVTAWNSTLESLRSNEIMRAAITSGGGGTTTPPPTGTTTKPGAPTVTASGYVVHAQPATSGGTATGAWMTLYPFNSSGSALTFADPVSGGLFPRDLDLTPFFTERIDAVRIEVEACAQNAYGMTCSPHLNVSRTAQPAPSPTLGTPGQPQIVQ